VSVSPKLADAWAPLHHQPFRALWIAATVVNLSIWMENIAAAWMMTDLQPNSPFMVSLVQTSMALPAFLLGLPSGVLADLVNRKRLLISTQIGSLGFSVILVGFAWVGEIDGWLLLGLTFAISCTNAFAMAAWIASTIDCAPQGQVTAAIALSTITPNIARVVGPALAGFLIAVAGTTTLFISVSAGFLLSLVLLKALPEAAIRPKLPPERMWNGMRSGLRYMQHSTDLRLALRLVFVFVATGSSIWALLPLVARVQLGFGASGFGLLLGSLGVGAMLAGFQVTLLYRHLSARQIIMGGGIGFAAITALIPVVSHPWIMCILLIVGGMAWMAVNTTIGTVIQTSAAAWVRARVASVYLLVVMGAMAAGGVIWGAIAQHFGIQEALWLSAIMIVLGLLLTGRINIKLGSETDFSVVKQYPFEPQTIIEDTSDGPVAVEIFYKVAAGNHSLFIAKSRQVGQSRRRNGALAWRLYRDLDTPDCFVERFLVDSWLDYLRHVERQTRIDKEGEEELLSFATNPTLSTRRYIAVA
jgi:MFS family permease